MVPGCLSACSPCNHQKNDPNSICNVCQESYDLYVRTTEAKAIADAKRILEARGYRIVPKEALDWLNGEAGTFEPPAGKRGNYWWRSEFRRRAGLQ